MTSEPPLLVDGSTNYLEVLFYLIDRARLEATRFKDPVTFPLRDQGSEEGKRGPAGVF